MSATPAHIADADLETDGGIDLKTDAVTEDQRLDRARGRAVRIGVQIQPHRCSYAEIRRAAARYEELGVDLTFNWHHFFSMHGPSDRESYECWTMLGAWAKATSRVQLGSLVTCASYHNPDLLAYMAHTVDEISEGRVVLGLGAGWHEPDHATSGYRFRTTSERASGLRASVHRILERREQVVPAPVRPILQLIGGTGPRTTLRLAAAPADIWHGFGDAEQLEGSHATLDCWRAAAGRDPAAVERSAQVFRRGLDEVGQQLVDIGTRLVQLVGRGPEFDPGPVRDWLAFRDDANRPLAQRSPA